MEQTYNCGEMTRIIYKAFIEADDKFKMFAPDALFRVFVYIAKANEWDLERMKSEACKGIQYYFDND